MTDNDHIELLEVIKLHPGPIIISGYDCDLYNNYLPDWNKFHSKAKAEGGRDAIETIWMNYDPPAEQMEIKEMS
jgi:DNA adenine methylase